MTPLSWDSETECFAPGMMAPPIACVTWQEGEHGIAKIDHVSTVEAKLRAWLDDDSKLFVLHNASYDFAVAASEFPHLVKRIFRAYKMNRVTDTMIRQRLLDIAAGVAKGAVDAKGKKRPPLYDLETLAWRCAGMRLQKDALRQWYGKFIAVPLEKWPDKMRELQAEARERIAEVSAQLDAEKAKRPVRTQDKVLIKALEKEYKNLDGVLASPAERCTEYPLDDARATSAVYHAQEKHAKYLKDQFRQARAAFALHLSSAWGICVDGVGVERLKAAIEREREDIEELLLEEGLIKWDAKKKAYTKDTKAAKALMVEVCREEGLQVIFSDAHFDEKHGEGGCPAGDKCEEHICLDADACERSDDERLIAYAKYATTGKQLSTDIPALMKGIYFPLHTRYWLAETGRSTSSGPNIQNQSSRPGFREAFIARPGFLFMQCDFPTLELYTLAQCCITWLGWSKLAETLRSGKDPHLMVAATILNKPYEWCVENKNDSTVKKARTLAKFANFGFPGGMGIKKFLASVRKQIMARASSIEEGRKMWADLALTEARAKQLKEEWFFAFPEMREYFKRISAQGDSSDDGLANVVTLFTERHRGRATYCARSNNGFQALGADCAKNAVWRVAEAQYAINDHPLFNTRTVAFVHDEIIGEVQVHRAHEAAYALGRMMADAANEFLPDVPIPYEKMQPTLMKRWSKKAEQRFDQSGQLIAWDFSEAA
jgi:hypothetical protein